MLQVEQIETFYGEAQALFGVSLSLQAGQALALLGRNGMGKSTTIRSICQLTPPTRGRITLAGQNLKGRKPFEVARLGIGLVPEGRRCFANLSVAENLLATMRPGPFDLPRIHKLFPRLAERASQQAATLSGGEQQMLAIGRALMTNPKLLLLDEATEGLAPLVRREILAALATLKEQGLAMLIVDKNLDALLPLVEQCVILERGSSVWTGPPSDLNADLRQHYLGV